MIDWDDDSDEGMYSGDRGFLVGRQAALQDWRFKKENDGFEDLVKSLRAKKWNREHPERRSEIQAKHYQKPGVAERQLARARQRRVKAGHARVHTCLVCGAQWCRLPGHRRGVQPRFCGTACYQRHRYAARKASR